MDEQEWKEHAGQSDPKVTGNPMVEVRFRDGDTKIGRMFDWDQNWQWADSDEAHAGDIVAYRLLPPRRVRR